jgi:hypothetical protein
MTTQEDNWKAFRRYKYSHIDVHEEPGRIEFRQVSGGKKGEVRVIRFIIFAVFIAIFLTLVSGNRDSKDWGLIFIFFGGIIAAVLMGMAPRFAKRWNTLEITPGFLRIESLDKRYEIKTENIASLEVRPNQYTHDIYIWDGPVAIYVFAMFNDADAIAIRNGIEAGIGMMNPAPVSAAVPTRKPGSRRSFAE